MSKVLAPLLAASALLLIPLDALAIEGELTLGLGPAYADLPTLGEEGQSGFGGAIFAQVQLDTFWAITAGSTLSYHLSDKKAELPGQRITSLWAGAIYNLDVFTYVPFFSLALTGYLADPDLKDPDGQSADAGAKIGFGVDWRRYRTWSLGAEVNVHAFITDLETYPVFLTTLIRLNYHIELF